MTGTGAGEPLGLFTPSDNGVGTARDVNVGNTTELKCDGLLKAEYSLRAKYRKHWLFHREGVQQIRLFKNAGGDYLWHPATMVGQPATFDGLPILESDYCPHAFTSGLYTGMCGDLSNYWIARRNVNEMQRLVELGAMTSEIIFIMRRWMDAQPVKAEAFARIKMSV
jgi:HK97 family phage major capsid protein